MKQGKGASVASEGRSVRAEYRILWGLLVLFLLPSVVLLDGCAGIIKPTSQAIAALFQLNPTSINFGTVTVGKKATQSVSISNMGTVAVNITQATLSNSQFSLSGGTLPMSLAAGKSGNISIAVTPSAAGTISGTLTVTGDGGSSPVVANLSATAVGPSQPQLSASPASIGFGTISNGHTGNANLVLSNTGSAPLTVSLITLTGSEFGITGIATPVTISAGQSVQATVTFSPTSAGTASGSVTITSNDPNNPTLSVPLTGTGSAAAIGQLSASPASVSFGTVATGSSTNKQVAITNTGNAAVNVSAVTASGTGYSVTGLSAPATLNPLETATLTVAFAPSAAGSAPGSVTVTSNATNSPLTIALSGTAAQAGLSVSPTSYNFGSIVDGETKSESFTITNTGTAPLTISQLSVTGSAFSASGLTLPTTIAAGGTATFSALFAPTTAGSLTGSVSITSNAPNSPNAVALSGTGTAATVTLSASPANLSFTGINVGSSSSQNVTITNNGNTSVTVSQVTVSAKDFTASGMANGLALGAGQSAVMHVAFSPTASESVTGNITVSSSQGSSAVVTVTGGGVQPALTVTPVSASFGNVTVGSPSTQTIQLSNSGTGTLSITQVSATGSGFSTSSLALPITLNAGQASSFTVQFAPAAAGAVTGGVTVVSNAPNSPATIPLSGTGVAAQTPVLSFSTASLGFGNVNTGSSSTLTETLTNTGNANVQISSISESGAGFALSGVSTPITLTPNQTTTFSVVFSPSAAGTDSGTVTVNSNATGSPTTIALSGTAAQAGLSVSPTSYNFGSIVDGQTKSESFTISNTGTAPLTISQLSVTGSAFSASGLTLPTTIAAGGTATFSALFAPTTAGSLTGSVSITSNAPNSPNAVALSGTGTAATVTLSASPANLSFTGINVGSSSSQNVTITNNGNTSVTVSQVTVSAKDFTASGMANGLALGAGQSAVMHVAFSPTASESVTGNITVSSSQGSSAVVTVTGGGVQPALTVTPVSASFGNVTVGSPSTQTIQLSNSGTGTLSITQVSATGSGFSTSSLALPITLNAGQVSSFTVQFAPAAAGAVTGGVAVVSNAPNSPATIPLSGTGVAAQTPVLSFSTASLGFGNVNTGSSSTLTETLTNTGNANVQISSISESGAGFALSGVSTPITLTPNQTTTFSVVFSPSAAGTDSGTVTVNSNATGSPTTIALSGTAAQAGLSVSPTSYNFGSIVDGQTKSESFTISNTGTAPLTISQLSVTGSAFSASGLTLPTTIAAGGTATFSALFAPTTAGSLTGSVSITSNAPNSPNAVALSGTGTAATVTLSASPANLSFTGINVGSSSSQNVTITNNGNTSVTVSQVTVSAKDFTASGMANGLALGAGQSAVMHVAFSPTASESVTGNITVSSSQGSSAVVTVTGGGVQPALTVTPASASFGNVTVGSPSTQTIQLSNSGTGTLSITQVSATGSGFSTSSLALPITLNAGQVSSFTVQFAPAAAGAVTGGVAVVSNAPNSPATIPLSGTGVAAQTPVLSFSSTSLGFGNVNTGSSSTLTETLTNTGNANVQISSISESGAGFALSGVSTPITLTPNQTTTFSVVFSPSAAGTDSGTVTVNSNATGSPTTIALSGTAAQAGLSVSPTSYNFGSIVDGQTKSESFTISNTGTAPLTISQLSATGSAFSTSGLTLPTTIAAGGTATFSALFAPTTAGSLTGSVSITSNAPNSPNAVALSGTGTAATVTLSASPANLSFTGINVGSSSSQNVTITNNGNASATISQVAVSAKDFSASGITTPTTLGAGQSAVMHVAFSPTASESVTGNITVSSSQGSSAVVTVTGGGVQPALTVTPASASFGNVTVGSPSTQTIQLSNSGTGTLSITQVSATGSGFSTSSLALPITLNAGQASSFTVQFAPAAAGAVTGGVTVVSNAPNSPATIPLSGTGVAQTLVLSFSSTSLGFGNVNTGSSSTLTETITNTGNANVQISGISESGAGFALSGVSTPVTLTPNQTTTFSVVFSPSAAGTDSGTVTVNSNATGSPTTITLSGTGQAVSHSVALAWNASTSTVSGYNVYRSTTNGSGYVKINSSLVAGVSYTDSAVQSSTTYYYVTAAVDSEGNESAYSNQATAVIP